MIVPVTSIVAAVRRRLAAFGSLATQLCFGVVVVSHALLLGDLFHRQAKYPGIRFEGGFAIATEADRVGLAAADLRALSAIDGVEAAAWVAQLPFARRASPELVSAGDRTSLMWPAIGTQDLARTLGFELIAGRQLTDADASAPGPVPVLVTRELAEALFPGASPLGRTLRAESSERDHVVVGVLAEAALMPPFIPAAFRLEIRPARPWLDRRSEYLVRTSPRAGSTFAAAAARELSAAAPDRVVHVATLADLLSTRYDARAGGQLLVFAVVSVVLSVVLLGTLGMASFLVSERKREIGMRRAIGASRADMVAYFVAETASVALAALLFGAAFAFALNQLVVRLMPLAVLDFTHVILGIILLLATSLAGAAAPALRAARVPPSTASKAI